MEWSKSDCNIFIIYLIFYDIMETVQQFLKKNMAYIYYYHHCHHYEYYNCY
jgi:hypothetical protein